MTDNLARLISGDIAQDSTKELDVVLRHLYSSIERVLIEITLLKERSEQETILYGPFLGRSLLELTANALIARIDPLRILIVKGNQGQTSYELGKPQKASINWKDDFIDDDKRADIWTDKSLKEPWRAMFGGYSIELVLTPGLEDLIDSADEQSVGDWYQYLTSEDLLKRIRNRIKSLYSTLSKGIHHEMLIPLESIMDNNTVKSNLNEVIKSVATLSLIVSFVPHAYGKIEKNTALTLYKSAKELEIN